MLSALISATLAHTLSVFAVSFSTGVLLCLLCAVFGSHRILKWPLLLVSLVHVATELLTVALILAGLALWERLVQRFRPGPDQSRLLGRLHAARSWPEYLEAGRTLDAEYERCVRYRDAPEDARYNADLVMAALQRLRGARADGDVAVLLEALSGCVRKSFCGIDHEALYSRCHAGTKRLVETFVDEVVEAIGELERRLGAGKGGGASVDVDIDEGVRQSVRAFLHRSQRCFGRTCLALSGGGALCNFSWGVARALLDEGLLPSLICGTSGGAVIASALCTRSDADLDELITSGTLVGLLTSFEDSWLTILRRLWQQGHMYDPEQWVPKIGALCNHARVPNITFEEASRLSGRELCITVSARRRHEPPLCLSRLSAPDVTVASAVFASVAMPFLIPAQRLVCKRADGSLHPWVPATDGGGGEGGGGGGEWRDGSIVHDTPRELLAQHFGVSYSIVSQCNPHVVPLHTALRPPAGQPALSRLERGRSEWRGGFLLSALLQILILDAKKWLGLMRELEITPLLLDTDWSHLFLQEYTGDATIMPPLTLSDYARMISDPTPSVMARYLRVGQRECWRKMPMLLTRLRIAHALQALHAAVRLRREGDQGGVHGGGATTDPACATQPSHASHDSCERFV